MTRALLLLALCSPVAAQTMSGGEVVYQVRWERLTIRAMVSQAAREQGVPDAVAHALVARESDYRVRAVGRSGEIGLTQIKLSTARGLGFRGTRAQLFDPATNLRFGLRYARMALNRGSISFYQTGW